MVAMAWLATTWNSPWRNKWKKWMLFHDTLPKTNCWTLKMMFLSAESPEFQGGVIICKCELLVSGRVTGSFVQPPQLVATICLWFTPLKFKMVHLNISCWKRSFFLETIIFSWGCKMKMAINFVETSDPLGYGANMACLCVATPTGQILGACPLQIS